MLGLYWRCGNEEVVWHNNVHSCVCVFVYIYIYIYIYECECVGHLQREKRKASWGSVGSGQKPFLSVILGSAVTHLPAHCCFSCNGGEKPPLHVLLLKKRWGLLLNNVTHFMATAMSVFYIFFVGVIYNE